MLIEQKLLNKYWTPNRNSGFLAVEPSISPNVLAQSSIDDWRLIGSMTPRLGSMSDAEVEDLVASLSGDTSLLFDEPTSPSVIEAVVRAYVNLSAHLIHRPGFESRRELPASVARPLWTLSKEVGRPPSLTYASYALANFTNPIHGRIMPADFVIAQTPSGTPDEEWFIAVHLSIESAGGEVIRSIQDIGVSLDGPDIPRIVQALKSIESVLLFAQEIMPTVKDRMDHDIFLNKIRPFLHGYKQILFRGVEAEPRVSYVGETGAQSGCIRAVDLILCVTHSSEVGNAIGLFEHCAPQTHQYFFKQLALIGYQLFMLTKHNADLRNARNKVLVALAEFREIHLNVVKGYLIPEGRVLAEKGTGGTPFSAWLQKLIDETLTDRT